MHAHASRPSTPRVTRCVGQTTDFTELSKRNPPPGISIRGGFGRVPAPVRVVPASHSGGSIQRLRMSAIVLGVPRQPVQLRNAVPSQVCHRVAADASKQRGFGGRMSQRGAIAASTHSVGWLPRNGRTLSAVADRRAVTVGGFAALEANVNAVLSNKPINPTHFAASRRLLAQASRRFSCAGYRQR